MALVTIYKDDNLIKLDHKEAGFKSRKEWYWKYYYYHPITKKRRAEHKKEWRKKNPGCILCGINKCNFHWHHIHYDNCGDEQLLRDIICICKRCHKKIHSTFNKNNDMNEFYCTSANDNLIDDSFFKTIKKTQRDKLPDLAKDNKDLSFIEITTRSLKYKIR